MVQSGLILALLALSSPVCLLECDLLTPVGINSFPTQMRDAENRLAGQLRTQIVLSSLANEYEILLVNDGSPDNSWARISALVKENSNVRGIQLANIAAQRLYQRAGFLIRTSEFWFHKWYEWNSAI